MLWLATYAIAVLEHSAPGEFINILILFFNMPNLILQVRSVCLAFEIYISMTVCLAQEWQASSSHVEGSGHAEVEGLLIKGMSFFF